jgi:hypothetical protein
VGAAEIAANAVGASEIAANAVGSSELATGGVGASEIATGAVGSAEIADGSVVTADLAANLIGGGHVVDGSLRLADVAVATGTVQVDLPEIQPDTCHVATIAVAGAAAGDMVLLAPPATFDDALYATTPRLAEAGAVRVSVCAVPGAPVDAPAAAWTFAVLRR